MDSYKTIDVLNDLRLPLILGVVFIHCNILEFLPDNGDTIQGFRNFMMIWDYFLKLCVPIFFFISGYMFFRTGLLTKIQFIKKIRRREHTLLIPYLLWNLIALATLCLKVTPLLAPNFPQYKGFFDSWQNIFIGFFAMPGSIYPFDMPLWFLRDLIIIVIVTPIISFIFKQMHEWGLLFFLAVLLLDQYFSWGIVKSLWYFSLGTWSAIYHPSLKYIFRNTVLLGMLFAIMVTSDIIYPYPYSTLMINSVGIFFIISISGRVLSIKKSYGGDKAMNWQIPVFFIYACHGLYCSVVAKFAIKILSPLTSSWNAFATYFLTFGINIFVTLSIYFILNKTFPSFTRILVGNRR